MHPGVCRSKLGGAHWVRMKLMAQFEAQIPDPLGDDLPALLAWCRMACPPLRVLFQVFIREARSQTRRDADTGPPHQQR